MTPAVETDKTLQEKMLLNISVRADDGTQEFSADFESTVFDVELPESSKPFEMQQLASGGQERSYDPEETKTVSGTAYIKGVDASTANAIQSLIENGSLDTAGSADYDAVPSLEREDVRVVATFTTADISSATASVPSGETTYRMVMQNAECVSGDTSFSDNELTIEFEIETTALTPSGGPNIRYQELRAGGSGSLVALPDYTDTFDVSASDFDTSAT